MRQSTTKVRKYSAPKLTVYGDMLKLTAGGTSGNAEQQVSQTQLQVQP